MGVDRLGASKSAQGRQDTRLLKHNKNVSLDLPDIKAETERENATAAQLLAEGKASGLATAAARKKGHGKRYGIETFQAITLLRRDGLTFKQIAKLGFFGGVRLPSVDRIYDLQEEHPELKEAWSRAFADAVRDGAEETIGLARSLTDGKHFRRLPGKDKVRAINARIGRQLQIARQRLPDEWGGDQMGERDVIVFETSGGWSPAEIAKDGDPGQGDDARAARERWKVIREQSEDATTSVVDDA